MLNKPIENIEVKDGMVHVTSEGETVKGKIVVGDPSYFPNRVKKVIDNLLWRGNINC